MNEAGKCRINDNSSNGSNASNGSNMQVVMANS